ncbi:MAG: DUF2851 family protein [Dehalococcoidia bacterium]|nr:DUF2851 family protein [Dehalococcoidia bacterium]
MVAIRPPLTEDLLAEIWKRQLLSDRLLSGTGEAIGVTHPGILSRDRGPDFTGAVIFLAGKELRGDIEVHVRASDWKTHGHHLDPNYNRVVLQVVWEGDTPALLENGTSASTLSLSGCLSAPVDELRYLARLPLPPLEPCLNAARRLGIPKLLSILEDAGRERFLRKAASFGLHMGSLPASQVLYEGIMGALGYTRNRRAFEDLACRLPLKTLEEACKGRGKREATVLLAALLVGKAGFLLRTGDLYRVWQRESDGEVMRLSAWDLFRVRPENHPLRRLLGMAFLLGRYLSLGLLDGIVGLVRGGAACPRELEAGMMVENNRALTGGYLIGRGRAREIVINIVLPFAFALAGRAASGPILRLYERYPGTSENRFTRDLADLLLGSGGHGPVRSALRQQGLLHLHRDFCSRRGCVRCPLGGRLPPANGLYRVAEGGRGLLLGTTAGPGRFYN